VPESVVPAIRLGESVEVKVPSLHRNFPGKVARFADRVNLETRTMETEVDVPNPQLVLVPGMYAEVDLTLERHQNALAIPLSALAGSKVYVVTPDNKIHVRDVTVGLETANRAEIRSGIQNGEMVVIGNRSQLTPGQNVIPKPTELAALE
jgi:RND family efflux transporter MFP subunit